MTDIWEFLDELVSKKEKSYGSEPVLKRASDLIISPKYAEMRKINPLTAEDNSIYPCTDIYKKFYLQAKLMEAFTEDYPISKAEYYSYYPRYDTLTANELRGYFSWRTKYRQGEIIDVSLTYLLIYASEIVNNIGIKGPQDGFLMLTKLSDDYKYKKSLNIENIIFDYCVYNNIAIPKRDCFSEKLSAVMDGINNNDFSDIIEILSGFSNHKITGSKFYLSEYRVILIDILPKIFAEMEKFYIKNRKITLLVKLFGHEHTIKWKPFSGIVFYNDEKRRDMEIKVNNCERYVFSKQTPKLYIYYETDLNRRLIGEIFKTTEHFLRDMTGFSYKIKLKSTSKILTNLIKDTIFKYLDENKLLNVAKRKKADPTIEEEYFEPVVVNIDPQKFEAIRKVSEELKEKLIVEEAYEIEEIEELFEPESDEKQETDGFHGFGRLLTNTEKEVLFALLNEQSIKEILDNESIMQEVIFESINEKALEMINDNIIDSDELLIYDEYKEELMEVVCK